MRLIANLLTIVVWLAMPGLTRVFAAAWGAEWATAPAAWPEAYTRATYTLLVTYLVVAPMLRRPR